MNNFSIDFEIYDFFLKSPQSNRNKMRKTRHFDEKTKETAKNLLPFLKSAKLITEYPQ